MKIHLDNCCFNRPYDDQDEFKVAMETWAKLHIQDEIRSGKYELVGSYMLQYENDKNPSFMKKTAIRLFQDSYTSQYVPIDRREKLKAKVDELMQFHIHYKDAPHLACAIYAHCDYLLTTDMRFQKRYKGNEIHLLNPVDLINLKIMTLSRMKLIWNLRRKK